MDPDLRRTTPPLTGDPPNPVNVPPGCRFHPRCAQALQSCSAAEPEMLKIGADHHAACFLAEAVAV
jgi:peptide/nickel transport system ATP-binding protein